MKQNWILLILLACISFSCQPPGYEETEGIIRIDLRPNDIPGDKFLRWSPKGEKLALSETPEGMVAELILGPVGLKPVLIRLEKANESAHFNQLRIDWDRDGSFDSDSVIQCTPNELRGKIWSSFSTSINIPFDKMGQHEAVTNPYPISFWYVLDPMEDAPEQVIRYSRRGWFEGSAESPYGTINALLTESQMNGVLDRSDSWALAPDSSRDDLYQSSFAKNTSQHTWFGEQAFGIDSILPSGRVIWIKAVDPQITRAEEERQKDFLAPDREAARSGGRVAFLHDYQKALVLAKKENKYLFIDFETTWCGPCKTMDQWVYTADAVVEASKKIICVKVDGDEHRKLVDKYKVSGYPTLVVVDYNEEVIRQVIGYQSVKLTTEFLSF